jgi:hypothetical protein
MPVDPADPVAIADPGPGGPPERLGWAVADRYGIGEPLGQSRVAVESRAAAGSGRRVQIMVLPERL